MNSVLKLLFLCYIITVVATACISEQETQAQVIDGAGAKNVPQQCARSSECSNCCCSPKKIMYLVGSQKVTWWQAYVTCKQSGMELASVTSNDEEIAVENSIKTISPKSGLFEGYWLAGTRYGTCNSDFVWLTTGKPMIYRKFSPGQPDNAGDNEACLQIFLGGPDAFAWNDIPCETKLGFVCQSSNECN